MKNIIVVILFLLSFAFMAVQCEAPRDCTDPDCVNSPISLILQATISDTSSVFSINDTLKMYISIPDTLNTNYENFIFESINQRKTWFFIDASIIDTTNGIIGGKLLPKENVKCVLDNRYKTGSMEFDTNRNMAEIHFTFPRKGKYYISSNIQGGRFVFKSKDNDWMLAMLNIGLNVKKQRHDLYLSWLPTYDQRLQMAEELRRREEEGLFWYAFEVK